MAARSSLALCFTNIIGWPGEVWLIPVMITTPSLSPAAFFGVYGMSVVLTGLEGLSSARIGLAGSSFGTAV